MKSLLDILGTVVMILVYIVTETLDYIREHWVIFLIAVVLLWPKISDRLETWRLGHPEETIAVEQTQPQHDATRAHHNYGVCRTLAEDACAVVLFVDDGESNWTGKEAKQFLENVVHPGLAFVENEAVEYGISLDLECGHYVDEQKYPESVVYKGVVADLDSEEVSRDLIEQCAEALGYENVRAMLAEDQAYYGYDQIAYLICLDKSGRSYASYYSATDNVEHAVLFSTWGDRRTRSDAPAHEFLHLFGAEDMYAEDGAHVNREKLAKKLHKYEIMLEYRWNIDENTIGPFTAYCIGWLDELPEEYDCLEWWS